MSIPAQAENVLHITAGDETRMFFPLTSALDTNRPNDTRITEISLPGAHSDIGGGYNNHYSRLSLGMAYDYMGQAGVPLKPMSNNLVPSVYDPNLRIHDSRWSIDKAVDGLKSLFGMQPSRGTPYYVTNPK